eukprot:10500507-Alexandrium_andersonii.AAC.1
MSASLVGSEMCIRDRFVPSARPGAEPVGTPPAASAAHAAAAPPASPCLLYTSTLPTICSV